MSEHLKDPKKPRELIECQPPCWLPGSSSCSFHTWQSVLQGESE